ncbi:MAG: RNA-binding domain-containing protein, partial [Bacteroidota bacterium]
MIDPREIFEYPEEYVSYMTASNASGQKNPEGKYFDRKEVRNDSDKQLKEARKNIVETISAFTNARGGLLALGIDDEGHVVGLDHLDEATYNSLVQNLNEQLTNHQARSRDWSWQGQKLLLIYAPEGTSGVCEMAGSNPRGWKREAANNLKLTPQDRERLLRERSQRFEHLTVCDYDQKLIHQAVFDQFRRLYLQEREANYQDNQEEFLRNIGAVRLEVGRLQFTYAGYLFFASNPRNQLPSAYVRLLKYESEISERENPGTAVFDRDVDGCLPELLRKVRSFVNDSPYFRRYSYRDPQGSGIKEEPEYPLSAVEEAIVNAMIHRDYHSQQPIVCYAYRDAFVVRSPGRLLQDSFVPIEFSLGDVKLTPYRRNVQLVEWARLMRDENEQRFVRSLAEGTRTMLDRVKEMNLPAPQFKTNGYTAVTFFNQYKEREARYKAFSQPQPREFTNLYPLQVESMKAEGIDEDPWELRRQLLLLLKNKLQNVGWFIDRDGYARLTTHRKGHQFSIPEAVGQWIRLYPGYDLQIHVLGSRLFLSVDYSIQVKNIATLDQLARMGINELRHRWSQVKFGGEWMTAQIEAFTEYMARVAIPELEREEHVKLSEIIPSLRLSEIKQVLSQANLSFPIDKQLKDLSLSNQTNASRARAEKIQAVIPLLTDELFPLTYNGYQAFLQPQPVFLQSENAYLDETLAQPFTLRQLVEPSVKFNDNQAGTKISDGLIRFGAFQSGGRHLELVPLVVQGFETGMEQLLTRLQQGSDSFRGMSRTFGIQLRHQQLVSKANPADFGAAVEQMLTQYPEWRGDQALSRAFLIHVPESLTVAGKVSSPYFSLKELLLEKGIPVQMV